MIKKVLTIGIAALAATVPLTAHAETVDEANQATQTAYRAYQQAELEKTQAWDDSHGDIYSAWQTADAKSRALYNAYLDARQHAGLVAAETNRDQSVSNSDVSESQSSSESQSLSEGQVSDTQSSKVPTSNSSASETQDLTGDLASKASNDSETKSATPTNDNDTTKAIQTAESNPQSETVVRQPVVASKASKTLPQTGNDIKNKTMLTLIGSGAMGIATVAMIILIRERRHD